MHNGMFELVFYSRLTGLSSDFYKCKVLPLTGFVQLENTL